MSRSPKATPSKSIKKGSKHADKADESFPTAPSVKADVEPHPEHFPAAEPDLNFPLKVLDEWEEPPVNWEMQGPPNEREISLNRENVQTPDTTVGLSPIAPDSDKKLITLLDTFAGHALNGILAGMLSIPNTPLDTAEIARMAFNYAEAMLRERQRRLDNGISSPSPGSEESGFAF
jgi:hypothetical protein